MLIAVLLILIVLSLGGFHPSVSGHYGYWPSGLLGTVVIVLLILWVLGRL